ncbi:MAG TPA: SOS response-associated peptidase [Xanthobacteraceae bacterium]|jgi:putative SOS response-associated peptidase YedK|nr:SOS response-associated peptidase [Xanthobacteraceae bacterium]
MCGRYAITTAPEAMRQLFDYREQPNFPPRYNIAPTQPVPVVRLAQGARQFALLRWGLVPAWVKDPKSFSLLHVARAESVNDKPAFRNAMRRRRCLLPADGFYEWSEFGERKGPFFIRPKAGGMIAFAGLWETWMGPNGEELESVAIITTPANRRLGAIAERMPAILPPESFDLWLDCGKVDAMTAAAFLVPAAEALLEAYPVSTAVNRTANDSPELIAPVSPQAPPASEPVPVKRARKPADDRQGSLF